MQAYIDDLKSLTYISSSREVIMVRLLLIIKQIQS
jgi:hypothetical protein